MKIVPPTSYSTYRDYHNLERKWYKKYLTLQEIVCHNFLSRTSDNRILGCHNQVADFFVLFSLDGENCEGQQFRSALVNQEFFLWNLGSATVLDPYIIGGFKSGTLCFWEMPHDRSKKRGRVSTGVLSCTSSYPYPDECVKIVTPVGWNSLATVSQSQSTAERWILRFWGTENRKWKMCAESSTTRISSVLPFSRSKMFITTAARGQILLYNVNDVQVSSSLKDTFHPSLFPDAAAVDNAEPLSIKFMDSSENRVGVCYSSTIKIYSVNGSAPCLVHERFETGISDFKPHAQTDHLISVAKGKIVQLWDLRESPSHSVPLNYLGHRADVQKLETDLNFMASEDVLGTIKIWDLRSTKKWLSEVRPVCSPTKVPCLALSVSRCRLLTANDQFMRMYEL
eukprot:TRINITY_DN3258_c0_g1_i1.p1 TRINITY_DN3258_c0_g1~~TRINITY_DN3258_c0_g1_i1.p1  ORF type:complete len:397 (-),score=56.06 TRINITY_DN3258_c0_g1_i1:22-1212(-)